MQDSLVLQANKDRFMLKQLKFQLNQHLERRKQEFSTKDFSDTCVNIPSKPSFDTICFSVEDNTNFFVTASPKKQIVKVNTTFDGYTLSLILCFIEMREEKY